MYKKLVWAAAILAFCVVVLGAYVRLSDAGLGCPDWPGCYGHLGAPQTVELQTAAGQAFHGGRIDVAKAWKEMVHRYFAGVLGILILAIGFMAWRRRKDLAQSPVLPGILPVLVAFQAALGMWTVTLQLKPAIVTAHLLGGMATLALLVWLAMSQLDGKRWLEPDRMRADGLRGWAWFGLLLVFMQIALGGWVSSNYAALACMGFPLCNGVWWPEMDFSHAFHFTRELGMTADGAFLSRDGLTAIHWVHRSGAYVVALYIGRLALRARHVRHVRSLALMVMGLLLIQLVLGVSNVLLGLPLAAAVAHNGIAALLLAAMVMLNFRLNSCTN